ncbi:C-terminal processing protease CtpA/Prc [Flavobacterium sp. 90]|uniref:S41 family peptidase n=1 Tax=unclassified Flavobacterium TaxID=196869 RepID=UPI000EB41CE4|nr:MULTISPECIES: S41 family peptidase [unclassified Flavobacterium]RKR09945.1 C-terminal processing protease CtpA/Prc [Flavobacterium sp. 81]TCK53730.1 C-terminal processing protease CtpA/Prc [Flavobacterium sp. 90]
MQKIILFLLIIFSQIIFGNTKITETEKLAATCKVWGFLKYYHPKVAKGEVNWDNQLLEKLPKIDKAQTKEEFSLVLENWIDDLGPVKEIAPIAAPKDVEFFDKNFDLSWFNNKLFSKKLSKKLKFIEDNRFQTTEEFGPGFDAMKSAKNYFDLDYTNKGPRILMLFAYWNLIEYYFPYKYVMDQKWDLSLVQALPSVVDAKSDVDFYIAIKKLIVKINDSHTETPIYGISSLRRFNYFPATGKIIDEKLVVTEILGDSLAEASNIKIGDVITKINGKTIKELISENRDLICASNEPKFLDKVVSPILRSNSENVTVEFLKDGKYETKSMFWADYHDSHRNEFKKGAIKKKEKFKLLDNNVGYVDMGVLKPRHVPEMIETLKSTKAIIFDMRNYPNETYEDIAKFLNSQEKTFCIYTYPYPNYPGRYTWTEGSTCGTENKDNYKGKVIVLLNEDSLSQSEWTAMCFQTAGNTTIIGSQTAGADGNAMDLDFKGFHTRYTGIGVFYPDKRETQRIGIVPDIEVKPTIKGIQEGRDEVLDRAIQFIQEGV